MFNVDSDGVIQTGSVFLRTPYNYNTDQASNETGLKCEGPGKTQQNFKEECDINTIVDRFLTAGEIPQSTPFPQQDEFLETFDFQSSMNVLRKAEESFMQLNAKVRARFNNNPQQFMEFMHDPANAEEMVKLKLANIRVEQPKQEAPKEEPKEKK